MSYPSYPEYRESGVEWLGPIPAHWNLKPLKYFGVFEGGGTPDKDNLGFWSGEIPWVSPKDMYCEYLDDTQDHITQEAVDRSATNVVPAGTLLLVARSGIIRKRIPVAVARRDMALNQDMKGLVGADVPKWLMRIIQSHPAALLVLWRKQGATVESLDHERVANSVIPEPPAEEAAKILHFLDHQTARIDALIAEQQRLIELLKEKRQAVISHAVTKGLNPDVAMKDSGVEWLGQVPEHWGVASLRRGLRSPVTNGLFKKKESFGSGIPLINVQNMYESNFFIDYEALDRVECSPSEVETFRVKEGDIFLVRSSLKKEGIAKASMALESCEGSVFECHLVRVRFKRSLIEPRYASFLLNSSAYRDYLIQSSYTTTMTTISQVPILEVPLLLPPIQEQQRICDLIEDQIRHMDWTMKQALYTVELLKERRSTLISAAVKGEIDVRDWQPPSSETCPEFTEIYGAPA